MKEQRRILMVGLLAVLVFAGAVQAEERPRAGELRGTFVRLTEQRVGERSYMGVVIKPLEGRDHVTVLLSQRQQELVARARGLREGQRLGVAYVTEAGHKWVKELEADRREKSSRAPDRSTLGATGAAAGYGRRTPRRGRTAESRIAGEPRSEERGQERSPQGRPRRGRSRQRGASEE